MKREAAVAAVNGTLKHYQFIVTERTDRADTISWRDSRHTFAARNLAEAYELMRDYGKRNIRNKKWKAELVGEVVIINGIPVIKGENRA